jgi:hypothetical protein
MAQTDLVCSKCVGRRTVNNIMMKENSKVMVTTVPPSRPLAYTRRPIFVSARVRTSCRQCGPISKSLDVSRLSECSLQYGVPRGRFVMELVKAFGF